MILHDTRENFVTERAESKNPNANSLGPEATVYVALEDRKTLG